MSEYFDRDFFKFLFGFVAIVSISLAIVLVSQAYVDTKNTSVVEAQNKCISSNC